MRAMFVQFRRAPGRIIASVLALSLAVAAIGVFAIPSVAGSALREVVARDGVPDLIVSTSALPAEVAATLDDVPGVERIEVGVDLGITVPARPGIDAGDGAAERDARLVGLDLDGQRLDVVHVVAGRRPSAADEVITSPDVAPIGTVLDVLGEQVRIVGHGGTLWWQGGPVVYADLAFARPLAPGEGTNRLTLLATDDGEEQLRAIADDLRVRLADARVRFTDFPFLLPDGSTPLDGDIQQVSTLIGLLGIVAGIVALVLLASTTSTLVTERTREVGVMRALGGRSRPVRRLLRRSSMAIAVAALVVGLPLGVVVSNVIARMVLEEFIGLTPDVAIDGRVIAATVAGTLVGARLVSARAARRVVGVPLVDALRDRDGSPFGRRRLHRLVTRIPFGGVTGRLALRSAAHRTARTVSVAAQIAAAAGAAFLVVGLSASVNEYNEAASAPWTWESVARARDAGLPLAIDDVEAPGLEAGIATFGSVEDWEIEVLGLRPTTTSFDPVVTEGTWLPASATVVPSPVAVVSDGFAARNDIEVGDAVELELATGTVDVEVVGLVDDHVRAVYLDRAVLAELLGFPGHANVVYADRVIDSLPVDSAIGVTTAAEIEEESNAGRAAIVVIFGAIGVVVAGVAALAVASTLTVSLYQRRHELAAMRAIGASRRWVRRVVTRELIPVGLIGSVGGIGLGVLGTRGIIASFEASNAVDIGVVSPMGAVAPIVVATVVLLSLLAAAVVRASARRSIATTLRGRG